MIYDIMNIWRKRMNKLMNELMNESMNESINDEAVYRTAPATPGLLMTVVTEVVIMTSFSKNTLTP
jgi:hypothetical protein